MCSATIVLFFLLVANRMYKCNGDMNDILAMVFLPQDHQFRDSLDRHCTPPEMISLRISCMLQEPYTSMDSSTGRFKGLEIDLVETLAHHLGLRADIELSENRSMLMQKLTNRSTDILIGGLFISDMDTDNVSITSAMRVSSIPYVFDDMTWCVATAKARPKWMNIFCIFPLWMWFALVIIGYVNSVLIYVMTQFEEPSNRWDFHRICLMMFCSNLALPMQGISPKDPGLTVFYMYMVFYGILLVATFNSFLIQNLTQPIRWNQVDTADTMMGDYMQVVGDPKAFVLFDNGQQNKISAFVRQHFWPCPDIDLCLDQLTDRDDLAVAVSRLHSRNTRSIQASQMFCFPQSNGNIINYPVRLLMRAGFPHVDRANDIIRRAFETGLIQKWSRDNERSTAPDVSPDHTVVLTLEHLAGAWMTLICLLPLSTLAFMAELLAWRRLQSARPGKGLQWAAWGERLFLQSGRSFLNSRSE